MNLFSSLDPAVKKLLGWKLGDEEDRWALKAVESLVKKMRKRKSHGFGTVEDLEYALSHPGSHSRCVTIPRSLDGRLQVSHRKGLPHVIYCRVWRWPNLQSPQELRPMPDCAFPYDGRNEQICINPYHYQRVELAGANANKSSQSAKCTANSTNPMMAISSSSCSSSSSSSSSSSLGPPSAQPNPPSSASSNNPFGHFQFSPSALSDDDDFLGLMPPPPPPPIANPTIRPKPICWCSICYYELNSRVGEPFKVSNGNVVVDGFTDPSSDARICLGLLSNVNRNVTIENTRRHIGRGIRLSCTDGGVLLFNQSDSAVFVQSRNANFKYGLQSAAVCRVPSGATMLIFDYLIFGGNTKKNQWDVDCGGKGTVVYKCGLGQYLMDRWVTADWTKSGGTVRWIRKAGRIGEMLEKAKSDGYQQVYDLQKMCFVRLSFVKGWGADYHRQDVTSTPCWLELQFHQPMAWIDMALGQLEPPDHNGITSVS